MTLYGTSDGNRTQLDGSNKNNVLFVKGDEISVFDGSDNNLFTTSISGTSSSAAFNGTVIAGAKKFCILYSFQNNATCNTASGTITATIPTEQTAILDNFDPKANVAVAFTTVSSNGTASFTLKNAVGLLRFCSDNTYAKAEISGENGENIAGTVTINASTGEIPNVTAGRKTITLTGKMENGKHYVVAMLPQAFCKGMTIKFCTNVGDVNPAFTKTIFNGSDLVIERSKITNVSDSDNDEIAMNGNSESYGEYKEYTNSEFAKVPMSIKLAISNSRMVLGENNNAIFAKGDEISVFDGFDNNLFTTSITANAEAALFSGEATVSAKELTILYPYQEDASFGSDGTITATVPTTQTATAGTFDPKATLAVATATVSGGRSSSCIIEHVLGLLKFISGKTYGKIVIKGVNGEKIAGTTTIAVSDLSCTAGSATEITLTGTIEGGKYYYVAMLPQEFTKGITMEFFDKSGVSVGSLTIFNGTVGLGPKISRSRILNVGTIRPIS